MPAPSTSPTALETALAAMAPGLKGIQIDSQLYRPANYIVSAIDNLTIIMIVAAALILLVLMWALFDWRAALIAAITIPVSIIPLLSLFTLPARR